jgi:integral membrane sensor domain MASE1
LNSRLIRLNAWLALLYILLGHISFAVSVSYNNVTSVCFAPEGISLAFAILYGYRYWPGVFIGQFILAFSTGLPWIYALSISVTNSLEFILAARVFARWPFTAQLNRLRDMVRLMLVVALGRRGNH